MSEYTYLDYTYLIIDSIKESSDYKRLINLQRIILDEYKDQYQNYISKKHEFMEYKNNNKSIDPFLANEFQEIKIKYYNISEVNEYMLLYKKINNIIFNLMEEITSKISHDLKVRGF